MQLSSYYCLLLYFLFSKVEKRSDILINYIKYMSSMANTIITIALIKFKIITYKQYSEKINIFTFIKYFK